MHGPIATILPDPSGPVTAQPGMYLCDVWAIRSDGREQIEFTTIAEFDTLVESGNVGYVMFGHYDFPRRAVRDMAKARKLVMRLLREYEEEMWGRFRSPATERVEPNLSKVEPSGPDEMVPLELHPGYVLERYMRFWHLVGPDAHTCEVWEDTRPGDDAIAHTITALQQPEPAPTPAPSAITAAVKRSLPTYTLTEQLEALRREAHNAQRQGLTQVVALLKERACALAENYLDDGHMCDKGHWLNEYGQCETCLEAAQQLACARMHVNETFQRWQFEAETTEVPF